MREFGQNVREDTFAIYGALSNYMLPVLYALLGACAFTTCASFPERVKRRTYHPSSYANTARAIAAMTVGAIISLFNIFSRDTALQPLALAFLAGYGVERCFLSRCAAADIQRQARQTSFRRDRRRRVSAVAMPLQSGRRQCFTDSVPAFSCPRAGAGLECSNEYDISEDRRGKAALIFPRHRSRQR